MSLAGRLRNSEGEIELTSHAFGATTTAFFLGFFGRPRTIDTFNNKLAGRSFAETGVRNYPVLSPSEEAELDTMKAQYDSLSQIDGLQYFVRIDHYSQLLQSETISASEWEAQVGL